MEVIKMDECYEYFKGYFVHIDVLDMSREEHVVPINLATSEMGTSLDVYNNLPHEVYIGLRDGTKFELQPRNNVSIPQGLYITRRVNFHHQHVTVVMVDGTIFGSENSKIHKSYMTAMRGGLVCDDYTINKGTTCQAYQQYYASSSDLRAKRTYYISNLDLLISLDKPNKWIHPYSLEGEFRRRSLESRPPRSTGEDVFYLNIELIAERASEAGERYVNLSGVVFRVPVLYRLDREAGVYITHVGHTTRDDPPKQEDVIHCRWSEIDKLPFKLFNSYHEAQAHGDIESQRKQEIARLEHRNKQLAAELEEAKLIAGKEKLQAESQLLGRKEFVEYLKWMPAVIGGLLTLVGMIRQLTVPPPSK